MSVLWLTLACASPPGCSDSPRGTAGDASRTSESTSAPQECLDTGGLTLPESTHARYEPRPLTEAAGRVSLDGFGPLQGTVSDRDGDRFDDLVFYDGTVVRVPTGDETLADVWIEGPPVGGGSWGAVFGAADLTGDGVTELLVTSGSEPSWTLLVFPPGVPSFEPSTALFSQSYPNYWQGVWTGFKVVNDITGDGIADLQIIATSQSDPNQYITLLEPPATGGPWSQVSIGGFPKPGGVKGVGDMDGDGASDLVVLGGDLLLHGGPAPFPPGDMLLATLLRDEGVATDSRATSGDLDGDGHPDLIVGINEESLLVIVGPVEDGCLRDQAVAHLLPGEVGVDWQPDVGDGDGDGRDDLLVGSAGYTADPVDDVWRASALVFRGPLSGTIAWDQADEWWHGTGADVDAARWIAGPDGIDVVAEVTESADGTWLPVILRLQD